MDPPDGGGGGGGGDEEWGGDDPEEDEGFGLCCIVYMGLTNILLLKPDGPKASMRRNPEGWLH